MAMKQLLSSSFVLLAACVATPQDSESAYEESIGLPPPQGALVPTAIAIQTDAPPHMVMVREGVNGAWRPAQRLKATTYEAFVSGPYTVMVMCPLELGLSTVFISQTLQDELLAQTYCNYEDYPYAVSGTMVQPGVLALGDNMRLSFSPNWPFEVYVKPGLNDLIATGPDRVLIQRNLSFSGDTVLPAPIDASQGIPMVPLPLTVTNSFPGETLNANTYLLTGHVLQGTIHRGPPPTRMLPTAALTIRDRQDLSVRSTLNDPFLFRMRSVRGPIRSGDAPVVTLPDPFANLTMSFDGNGDLMASWTSAQPQSFLTLYAYDWEGRYLEHQVSTRYLTATNTRSVTLESDVPGYLPEWRLDYASYNRSLFSQNVTTVPRTGFQQDEYELSSAAAGGEGLGAPRIDAIKQSRLQQVRQEVAKRHRERLENQ